MKAAAGEYRLGPQENIFSRHLSLRPWTAFAGVVVPLETSVP